METIVNGESGPTPQQVISEGPKAGPSRQTHSLVYDTQIQVRILKIIPTERSRRTLCQRIAKGKIRHKGESWRYEKYGSEL